MVLVDPTSDGYNECVEKVAHPSGVREQAHIYLEYFYKVDHLLTEGQIHHSRLEL